MSTPRLTDVENYGKGNCGFYAFANGLIPVLQRDIQTDNLERISKLEVAIARVSEKHPEFKWENARAEILAYSPPSSRKEQKKQNPLLDKFNCVLREMLVAEKIKLIEDSLQKDDQIDQENRLHMTSASVLISDIQRELSAEVTRDKFNLVSQCIQILKNLKIFEWDNFEAEIKQFNPNKIIEKDRILTKFYHLLRQAEDTKACKDIYSHLMRVVYDSASGLLINPMYQIFLPKILPSIARLKSNETMVEAVGMLDYYLGATNSDAAIHDAELMRDKDIKKLIQDTAAFIKLEENVEVQRAKLAAQTKSLATEQKPQAVMTPREEKIQFKKLDQRKEDALSGKEKNELSDLRKIRKSDLADSQKARIQALLQQKEDALNQLEKNQFQQLQQNAFMADERRYRRLKTYLIQASDENEEVKNDTLAHSSVIHKTISQMLVNGTWAITGDLGVLAHFFDVSLVVLEDDNNQARQQGDLRPSIYVRNYDNGHWVTVFNTEDQNQATLNLSKNNRLTPIAAKVLARDDETSQLLCKTIKTLKDNEISYPTDFFMNDKKEDQQENKEDSVNLTLCRAINNLGNLKLLTQEWSFPMLAGDPDLAKEIASLTKNELHKLNTLLDVAFDMGIEFKKTVEWFLKDPIGMEKHIQITCLRKSSEDIKLRAGKFEGLKLWGFGSNEKRQAISKVIEHLEGSRPLFTNIDIDVIKDGDLSKLLASLQIYMQFGDALRPEDMPRARSLSLSQGEK